MKQQKKRTEKLRIAPAAAHKLRERLLTSEMLSAADLKMILAILDDVYPRRRPAPLIAWGSLLAGIAVGFGLVVALLLTLA